MSSKNKIGSWKLDREANVFAGNFDNGGVAVFPGKYGDAAATFHDGAWDPVSHNDKYGFSYIYKDLSRRKKRTQDRPSIILELI